MTTVYIEQQDIPQLPFSLVFWPNYKFPIKESRLFLRDIMEQYQEPFFTIVPTPMEADFFAVPFEFFDVLDHHSSYLEKVYASALAMGKKVLLFDYTDYVDRVPTLPPHAVLFRVSAYRHHKQKNEIIMPYFVEDLGSRYAITAKETEGNPRIGYCGQSGFASVGRHVWALIKWSLFRIFLAVRLDAQPAVHKRGVFWRKKALSLLHASGLPCDFIVRRFYSLHRKSGSFKPEEVRREYIENLRKNDVALCVRGDANASQRFYEVLSASRIPLFLDTDCVLPLEEVISYDDFMTRVPSYEVADIARRAQMRGAEGTGVAFLGKERKARQAFETHLRLDRYFALVFDRERSPYNNVLFT